MWALLTSYGLINASSQSFSKFRFSHLADVLDNKELNRQERQDFYSLVFSVPFVPLW